MSRLTSKEARGMSENSRGNSKMLDLILDEIESECLKGGTSCEVQKDIREDYSLSVVVCSLKSLGYKVKSSSSGSPYIPTTLHISW